MAFYRKEYFFGSEVIPIHLLGTPFSDFLCGKISLKVPYGTVDHYTSIANNVGKKSAVRAAGSAIGANQLPG